MSDCLFCKIVSGQIPAKTIHETQTMLAFYDVSPAAPVHALVIPKRHVTSVLEAQDEALLGEALQCAADTAKLIGLGEDGFRLVINTGRQGGQTVPHLHIHILGGRDMSWPPG